MVDALKCRREVEQCQQDFGLDVHIAYKLAHCCRFVESKEGKSYTQIYGD